MFKKIDAQFAFTGKRTKNQEKTLRRLLNIDSRTGVYEGFQTPFFPINLSPHFWIWNAEERAVVVVCYR